MDTFSISNTLTKGSVYEDFSEPGAQVISNERIHKGDPILETYRVESDAIRGGMGSVWRVRHEALDKALAMKRPQPRFFAEAGRQTRERFIQECEAWIGLGLHPNIVACYYVRDIGGVPTIFAEWMEGGSLEKRIRDGSLYEGTPAGQQQRLLRIALQFARGLHFAHDRGLVHQDVKPDNVLLTADMKARVSDFGLSGAYGALAGEGSDGTIAGSGAYTPAYCSPEQERREKLSIRTDIYSWAVSVMEMYTGGRRWESGREAGERCMEFLSDCRLAPPEGLAALLGRCMRGDEAERPSDFGEVEDALRDICRGAFGADPDDDGDVAASDSADSLNNQAVSYMELGMSDSAVHCWDEAGDIDPTHVETIYNRALIAWRTGVQTDQEVWRQLMSHPFFMRTEDGRRAMDAITREAGKARMDEPLFEDEAERECSSPIGLWHGRAYAPEAHGDGLVLKVMDAAKGETIEDIDLSDVVRQAGGIAHAFMSEDCAQVGLVTRDNRALVWDVASRTVIREARLVETGMYDSGINYMLLGTEGRFLRRMVSHGLGHAAPTPETYDLQTGSRIRQGVVTFADWQLINAGASGPVEDPKGEDYLYTLCDGLRAVPVLRRDKALMACDASGEPVADLPRALAKELPGVRREMPGEGVRRITGDGSVWLEGSEGLMQFDLASGKCLRSYALPSRFFIYLSVDERGEGVIWRKDRGMNEKRVWKYRELPPVREEDRADWLISTLESFEEYRDRIRRLGSLYGEFRRADAAGDTGRMCRIYDEASGIRRFFGSEEQRSMIGRLNAACRQRNGYMLLLSNGELTPEEREGILAPFDLEEARTGQVEWSNAQEPPLAVCWKGGTYAFSDEAEKQAFTRQFVDKYRVLDVDAEHGLIAAVARREKGGTEYSFRVWSVDERRFLLDLPLAGYFQDKWITARFGRSEGAQSQMLLATSGVEPRPNQKRPPYSIYQFSCEYGPEPMRRVPPASPGGGQPGGGDVGALHEAYRECAAAAANRPSKDREDAAQRLKLALRRMGEALDADGLSRWYEEYSALAKTRPASEGYGPLRDFAQSQLAYALSHRNDPLDRLRALDLYGELAARHPEQHQYRENGNALGEQMIAAFTRMGRDRDAEGLKRVCDACGNIAVDRRKAGTLERVCRSAREQYAYAMFQKGDDQNRLGALFLYDGLAAEYPDAGLYRKNADIIEGQLIKRFERMGAGYDSKGLTPLYEACRDRADAEGTAAGRVCACIREQYANALARPGVDNIGNRLRALDLYCDLMERRGDSEPYRRKVDMLANQVMRSFENMAAKFDVEGLEPWYDDCAARLAAHPGREVAVKLHYSAEAQLAFALSRREDIASKERALEMYEALRRSHPEEPAFSRNAGVLEGQLFRLRREQKKQDRRAARAEGKGGLFSIFRRK